MHHIHLNQVPSTNSYLHQLVEQQPHLPNYTVVTTTHQTAGRGQKGNHWEANAGENITLSLLIRPTEQLQKAPFALNMATSLALHDLLSPLVPTLIKWPNDILVAGKRKIAGILTENSWSGNEWDYSIVGIGLNVMQRHFAPYTPPATSLALEGATLPTPWHHLLVAKIVECIEARLAQSPHTLRTEYHHKLFRWQQAGALYALPNGTPFPATLLEVLPNGLLVLLNEETQQVEQFAFKQVQFR